MKVKGSAIISTLDFVNINYGKAGLKRILNVLDETDKKVLNETLFATFWYPLKTLINLSKAVDDEFGIGDLSFIRRLGSFSASHDLRTIYRIFYKIGSPQFVISRASQVFATYYDAGNLETIDSGKGFVILELIDFPEIDEVLIQRISGWIEKTLTLSGGENVKTIATIKEKAGKEYVEFNSKWD